MAQVFTSYSRRDTETVDTIVEKMSQAGISVWVDRSDIKAGNEWRVQIVKAIDTCNAFVLMLSPHSAASDNVRREIDLSFDSERRIFAMMLDPSAATHGRGTRTHEQASGDFDGADCGCCARGRLRWRQGKFPVADT